MIMVKRKSQNKTKYFLKEHQMANIILAARGKSKCKKANNVVKRLDKKYKLH